MFASDPKADVWIIGSPVDDFAEIGVFKMRMPLWHVLCRLRRFLQAQPQPITLLQYLSTHVQQLEGPDDACKVKVR